MLTQTFRELETDGLVKRTVYLAGPLKVKYTLLALGRTLVRPMTELGKWAESHSGEIEAANLQYAKRSQEERASI